MSKRPYESQRMPYRDYQRSRFNKSFGYAFDRPMSSGSYFRPRRSGPYASSYKPRRYSRRSFASRVAQSLSIEKKFFDTDISFSVDATGEVPATGQLVLIPQGVTQSTRVGRGCQVKSIQLRLNCLYNPGADTAGCTTIVICLVQDTQANGAAALITDVLTSNVITSAMVNLANSERFKILRRYTYVLQSGAGVSAAYGKDQKQLDDYIKLNVPLEFSAATGALTELKSNNFFLLAGTDSQTTDDEVAVAGTCRVRFTDL